mgnify:CR=1 FL=1
METLNLIKNDPWLEPFADAINGRHQHAIDKESELTNKGLILHPDTSISACIVLTMVGFSVNGRLTQPKSLWSELLTIGKKKKNIA